MTRDSLPEVVDLGYCQIKVIETADMPQEDAGLYQGWLGQIKIQPGMPSRERFMVLLHELGHAIYRQYGLKAGIEDANMAEEAAVNAFGCGFAEILLRNPRILALAQALAAQNG